MKKYQDLIQVPFSDYIKIIITFFSQMGKYKYPNSHILKLKALKTTTFTIIICYIK